MSAEQLAAAEAMYHTLANVPCCCVFEYPYQPRGKLKHLCARCRTRKQWEIARGEAQTAEAQS